MLVPVHRACPLLPQQAQQDSPRCGKRHKRHFLRFPTFFLLVPDLQALQKSRDPEERAKGAWRVAAELLQEEGVAGFWKVCGPCDVFYTVLCVVVCDV